MHVRNLAKGRLRIRPRDAAAQPDPLAGLQCRRNPGADLEYDTSTVRPRRVRQFRKPRVFPTPDVSFDRIHTGSGNADDQLPRSGRRIGNIRRLKDFRFAKFTHADRFHDTIF